TPLATALGLIAAIVIGDIAIKVGLFRPEVVLYAAISTMGAYVTPSYELSVANKLMNFFLVLISAFFGVLCFSLGFLIRFFVLANLKSLRAPYLWPFLPFDAKAMLKFIFRIPVPFSNGRPSIVHPQDKYSQPMEK